MIGWRLPSNGLLVDNIVQIQNKSEFYRLWTAGVLGNATRIWHGPSCVTRAIDSGAIAVGFREIGKAGGGHFEIVPRELINETAHKWCLRYCVDFTLSEAAPDHLATLQGEVCQTVTGWEAHLGLATGQRMREASKTWKRFTGVSVVIILNQFMDPSSRDSIDELFSLYPDAVIEFACYSRDIGTIPNRNTIIWEVRNY